MRVPREGDGDGGAGRVLIVDASTDGRLVARMVLEGAGFDTVEADTPGRALDLLRGGERPDLLLLALRVGMADGFALLDRARDDGQGIPVVVLTSQVEVVEDARLTGPLRPPILLKPFRPDQLVDTIDGALQATDASVGRQ